GAGPAPVRRFEGGRPAGIRTRTRGRDDRSRGAKRAGLSTRRDRDRLARPARAGGLLVGDVRARDRARSRACAWLRGTPGWSAPPRSRGARDKGRALTRSDTRARE